MHVIHCVGDRKKVYANLLDSMSNACMVFDKTPENVKIPTSYMDLNHTVFVFSNFIYRYPSDNSIPIGELIAATYTGRAHSSHVLYVGCRATPFVTDVCGAHSRLKNYGNVRRTCNPGF